MRISPRVLPLLVGALAVAPIGPDRPGRASFPGKPGAKKRRADKKRQRKARQESKARNRGRS